MDVDGHSSNSLFRTGTGKRVNISSSALAGAKALLEASEDAFDCDPQSLQQTKKLHTIGDARGLQHSSLAQLHKGVSSNGMKRVGLRLSPLSRASPRSMNDAERVGGNGRDNYSARNELGINGDCHSSNSLFKTGSGKTVNISSNGLARAKALLEQKEDAADGDSQSLQQTANVGEAYEPRHLSRGQLGKHVSSSGMMKAKSHFSPLSRSCNSSINNTKSAGGTHTIKNDSKINHVQPENYGSNCTEGSVKFSTAGGRSLSVSNDALQQARKLLGDPDLGGLFDEGDAGTAIFSFPKERQSENTTSYEGNVHHSPLYHNVTEKSKYINQSFTSPMKPSGHMEYSTRFPSVGTGSNLISKFNAVGEEIDCLQNSISSQQATFNNRKQVSGIVSTSSNGFSGIQKSSSQTLVEISNTVVKSHSNNRQPVCGNRRLGPRVNVSSFKQPRSNKLSALLKQNVSVSPDGNFS